MRYILMLLLIFSNLFSFSQGYKIKVKIRGLGYGDTLLLGHRFGEKLYADDTCVIDKNNWGVFQKNKKLDGGIYIVLIPKLKNRFFEFLMDNTQNMEIETDTTDFVANLKVKGSKENEVFFNWQRKMAELEQKMRPLQEKYKKYSQNNKDSAEYFRKKIEELDSLRKREWRFIIDSYKDHLLPKILKVLTPIEIPKKPQDYNIPENHPKKDSLFRLYQYLYYKDHYWDNVDFSDDRLLRTPFIEQKIKEFYKDVVVTNPDSLSKEAIKLIERARANRNFFQYVVAYSANYFETSQIMGLDKVFVDIAERYYLKGECWWADSTLIAKIAERVIKIKPNIIGNVAPDLKMQDIEGNWQQLKYIKADYIILAFWEPSCGHCKKEIPKLFEYFKTVVDSGVAVFAVYTQQDFDEWKKFVDEKNLYFPKWFNVWDRYNFTNFRLLYDIYSTPTIYVIDKDKKIIAKRIGADQIPNFIRQHRKIHKNK
ncbi:MAG: redoxin domain-containing protein [Bacteroidales bacterium]|nr:redoxin domain-containing protein [Bacteroidales bacterium]